MSAQWGTIVKPGEAATPPPAAAVRAGATPLIAWSHSRLSKWEQCPASLYYGAILKVPEPKSPQMLRGTAAHEDAARVLTGKPLDLATTPLSAPWIKRLETTRQTYGTDIEVELQQAFKRDWSTVSWFDKSAWLRIVFDTLIVKAGTDTVLVQEHKTGKPRAEHTAQASLYAVGALALVPGAAVYEVTINYLDLDPYGPQGVVRHSFTNANAQALVKPWEKRSEPMLLDTTFTATPGRHCGWCAFGKSKGGPCSEG